MRVDAHQHFWLPDRVEYSWMKPLAGEAARRLVRPVLPAELEPILAHQGVVQTVLVQAAAHEAEADLLLSLAERHASSRGRWCGWIWTARISSGSSPAAPPTPSSAACAP
jgi:L-fuconolactonase